MIIMIMIWLVLPKVCIYLGKRERRGLISIEDWVELAIRGLEVCIDSFDERLIQATTGDKIDGLGVSSSRKVF